MKRDEDYKNATTSLADEASMYKWKDLLDELKVPESPVPPKSYNVIITSPPFRLRPDRLAPRLPTGRITRKPIVEPTRASAARVWEFIRRLGDPKYSVIYHSCISPTSGRGAVEVAWSILGQLNLPPHGEEADVKLDYSSLDYSEYYKVHENGCLVGLVGQFVKFNDSDSEALKDLFLNALCYHYNTTGSIPVIIIDNVGQLTPGVARIHVFKALHRALGLACCYGEFPAKMLILNEQRVEWLEEVFDKDTECPLHTDRRATVMGGQDCAPVLNIVYRPSQYEGGLLED